MRPVRLVSWVKQTLVPAGKTPRKIQSGLLRGLWMNIDLEFQTQIYAGIYERELNSSFKCFSDNIRTGVDIGSGYGVYTLFFLSQLNVQKIFSFEPDPAARAQLAENLTLNGFRNNHKLILSEAFVSNVCNSTTITLDSALEKYNVQFPCLIKVDVEGGELKVLQGAEKIVSNLDCRWIIETHSAHLEIACAEFLAERGYHCKIVKNAWWRLILPEKRPLSHNRWLIAAKDKIAAVTK